MHECRVKTSQRPGRGDLPDRVTVREVISWCNDTSLKDFKLGSNIIQFTRKQNDSVYSVANGMEGATVETRKELGGFVVVQAKEDGRPRWIR